MRRLAFGLLGITAAAITIAGCASGGSTQTLSVGPSFAPQTLYATNSTQNGISIYSIGGSGSAPAYEISTGGQSGGLNGPQYIAFDMNSNLFVTNWQQSGNAGAIVELKAAATGNVVPYNALSTTPIHPRGIADFSYTFAGATTPTDSMVVALVDPAQPLSYAGQLQILAAGGLLSIERIAGPNTGLNVPSGVAVDKSDKIYVTNLQGGSVEVFALPSPSPTPSPTATASPTPVPSPTATPTGATPSPTPTPEPTATPVDIAPVVTIAGGTTSVNRPSGIAIDTNGNVYVSDQASKLPACAPAATCPAILVFSSASVGSNYTGSPAKFIAGAATKLVSPTDVKVDGSGNVFVADTTTAGAGVVYEFAAGSTGNVAPTATYTSTGAVIGLGFTP